MRTTLVIFILAILAASCASLNETKNVDISDSNSQVYHQHREFMGGRR